MCAVIRDRDHPPLCHKRWYTTSQAELQVECLQILAFKAGVGLIIKLPETIKRFNNAKKCQAKYLNLSGVPETLTNLSSLPDLLFCDELILGRWVD